MIRNLTLITLSFILICGSTLPAAPFAGTTTFEPPVEITPPGTSHDFGKHAVTRLVDWEGDGDLDLLIGGGDGRVWIVQNQGKMKFAVPAAIQLQGEPLKLGSELTTACFTDLNGDHKPDLIVAHSNHQIAVLVNQGSLQKPEFAQPQPMRNREGKPLALPKGCGGRIDLADWDHDGDADLIAGNFSGPITCFANVGTAQEAKFSEGIALKVGTAERNYSYNVHPTLYDINCDGRCDVAYGMNWGTIGFLMCDQIEPQKTSSTPSIATEVSPILSTGKSIDLRSLAGDDATPTFGDLDGDGTLDMVSGGRREKSCGCGACR
jgi:FG-GAP-like repeat